MATRNRGSRLPFRDDLPRGRVRNRTTLPFASRALALSLRHAERICGYQPEHPRIYERPVGAQISELFGRLLSRKRASGRNRALRYWALRAPPHKKSLLAAPDVSADSARRAVCGLYGLVRKFWHPVSHSGASVRLFGRRIGIGNSAAERLFHWAC